MALAKIRKTGTLIPMKLSTGLKWIWPVLCLGLTSMLWVTVEGNQLLRERLRMAKLELVLQARECSGIRRDNIIWATTFKELGTRLHVDTTWMPMMATAIWRQTGEPASGDTIMKELRKRVTIGPKFRGIGGSVESDSDEGPWCRKLKRK